MPVIQVSILKGGSVEKKRKLVSKLTEVMVETWGVPKEAVTIHLREDDPENVGVGGVLFVDRKH